MEKFSWFVPIDIIEKADSKKDENGLPEKLLIAGVASSPHEGKDVDGQTLMPSGFDYAPLLKNGYLNLEHAYSKTKDASMIIGEPTNAFVKNNEFHIEGELYKDNPKAVALYKLGQTLKKAGSTRKIGYSIEGFPTEFDPKDKSIIKAARITGVALTLSPKCKGTQMILKGGDIEYETQEGSEYLIDMLDENGDRITVDKNLNIEKGGEGSRGGKVIGHTKSGKAIYENSDHESHKNFHENDHFDAYQIHEGSHDDIIKQRKKIIASKHGDKNDKLNSLADQAGEHAKHSNFHYDKYLSSVKDNQAKIAEKEAGLNKAMEAGSITGTDTLDQPSNGPALKEESVNGAEKKKKDYKKLLSNLRKRRGESYEDDAKIADISKAEVFTYLIKAHNMDLDSCKSFWELASAIQSVS